MTTFDTRHKASHEGTGQSVVAMWVGTLITISWMSAALLCFPELRNSFMIPVALLGLLTITDLSLWIQRCSDPLHPRTILGVYSIYFFFVTPQLHVLLNVWPKYVIPANDWRAALGAFAWLNVGGYVCFLMGRSAWRRQFRPPRRIRSSVGRGAAVNLAAVCRALGVASFGGWILLIVHFGGPSGYIAAIEPHAGELAGYGPWLLVAEAFPLLLFVSYVTDLDRSGRLTRFKALTALCAFLVLQFLVAGLSGSRSSTVWAGLIAASYVHILSGIKWKQVAIGVVILLGFSFVYGFYKTLGGKFFHSPDRTSVAQLSTETGRDWKTLFLEDFGRADIQALLYERVREAPADRLSMGGTYLGDASFLMPGSVRKHLPGGKNQVGTDFLYGVGAYVLGEHATRIYGLAGEAVMNFGPFGIFPMFFLFGRVVVWIVRGYERRGDNASYIRTVIVSTSVPLCILLLVSDFDNVLWYGVKQAGPLLVAVMLSRIVGGRRDHKFQDLPVSKGRSFGRTPTRLA